MIKNHPRTALCLTTATVVFLSAYAGSQLTASLTASSTQDCVNLAPEIRHLNELSNTLSATLASVQAAVDGIDRMQTQMSSSFLLPGHTEGVPKEARQQAGADDRVKSAPAGTMDVHAAERVRQRALDAFISGTHLKTIMASGEFGSLPDADQDMVISEMVQLVNDGLVSDELIYGAGLQQ